MPTRRSRGSACGRAAGWRWRASCAASRSAPTASTSCRRGCRSVRAGTRPGAMAGGTARRQNPEWPRQEPGGADAAPPRTSAVSGTRTGCMQSGNDPLPMHRHDWVLLVLLSVLWGGSFFFNGVALREVPPLTVAFVRVAGGALCLLAVIAALGGTLPKRAADWLPFAVMGLVNNVIPFSLFLIAQTIVSSGLAAVLNATTPLFAVLVMAAAGEERLTGQRVAGVAI